MSLFIENAQFLATKRDMPLFLSVLQGAGLEPKTNGSMTAGEATCPACGRRMDFHLNSRGEVEWTCFHSSCLARGDIYDLQGHLMGLDSNRALKRICAALGQVEKVPLQEPKWKKHQMTDAEAAAFGARAAEDARARAVANPEKLEAALKEASLPLVTPDDVQGLGLTPNGRIAYCYKNGVKVRSKANACEKARRTKDKSGIWWSVWETPSRFVWAAGRAFSQLWLACDRGEAGRWVCITEGESDAIALTAVFKGVKGSWTPWRVYARPSASTAVDLPEELYGRPVMIFADRDADGGGERAAEALAAQARAFTGEVRTWTPPLHCKDVRQFIDRWGREALLEFRMAFKEEGEEI